MYSIFRNGIFWWSPKISGGYIIDVKSNELNDINDTIQKKKKKVKKNISKEEEDRAWNYIAVVVVAGPASNGLAAWPLLRNIARHIKKKKKLMMNEATRGSRPRNL
jgi:hypothetical protein